MPLASEHHGTASSDERGLWRAVVAQALTDAVSQVSSPRAQRDRAEARTWLTVDSGEFQDICLLADLDPDQVRRLAADRIAAADGEVVLKPNSLRRVVSFNGESMTLAAWADRLGLSQRVLYARLVSGWSDERALSTPVVPREKQQGRGRERSVTFDDHTLTLSQWCDRLGIGKAALIARLKRWPVEKALTMPPNPRNVDMARGDGLRIRKSLPDRSSSLRAQESEIGGFFS